MLRILLFLLAMILATAVSAAANEPLQLPAAGDIRVLIDISGSMKKNDPANLRRPALKLITQIIPDGSVAGVWTFGQYVNALVPHRKVDDEWRKLAIGKAEEVNSVALFTNIGGVLEKSFDDFVPGKNYGNTHFILLTDGVVDISKTSGANVAERQRIIGEILARFRTSGAKIHTIALSASADAGLLERLAVDTGGIAAVASTAEDLTRVFLQAFDKAAPAEEVPLDGNVFLVDSGIEEFTALVFRKKGSAPIHLIEPSQNRFNAGNRPDYVNWYQEGNYDLITVKRPFEGEWTLDGELDAGSRVTVVSNLRMVLDKLPATFFAGDQLQLRAGFFENGALVMDPKLLKLIDVDVTIRNHEGKEGTKRISDPGRPPEDGMFRERISKLKEVGTYEVIVNADGKTFKRQARQRMQLGAPLAVELQASGSGDTTAYRVVARILSPNIEVEKTAVVARVKAPDGGTIIKSLDFNANLAQWEFSVEPARGDGEYEVALRVDGFTIQGSDFRFDPERIVAVFPRQEASPDEYASLVSPETVAAINQRLDEDASKAEATQTPGDTEQPVIDPALLAAAQAEQAAAAEPQANESTQPEPADSGWLTWVLLGSGVLLLGLLAGLGFWAWRRKKKIDTAIDQRTAKGRQQAAASPKVPAESRQSGGADKDSERKKAAAAAAATAAAAAAAAAALAEAQAQEEAQKDELAAEETGVDLEDEIEQIESGSDDLGAVEAEPLEDEVAAEAPPQEIEEEFNLEDFDIGDTDELPPEDGKSR